MENGGLSASDVALMSKDGFGGDAFIWIFALLILSMGGFGGWGNNGFANAIGYENLSTSNEVQRGFDNQNALAGQREILGAVTAGTAQSVATTNQTFHDTLAALNDKYGELARDISGVAMTQAQAIANQNDCCCSTKMLISETAAGINANIAQNRYEAAMNTQKVLDALAQNKIEELTQKVNSLELANATSNVVRYPNNTFYSVPSPCFNTCGCMA